MVTFNDITERTHAREMLEAERRRLTYILEGTNVGTWEWNVQTGELIINERWAGIVGYPLHELEPISIETWKRFAHPDDYKTSVALLERVFSGESDYYECEARMRHKDGGWVWVLDRGKVATWTDDGKPLMMSGTHQDITARKSAEERIRHLATHDALTGLPTLRLAKDRLSMTLALSRRHNDMTALMFIDLDGFKAINDSLGHEAGDEVLKHVAENLLSSVRETDTVARIGGDEFLLIAGAVKSDEDAGGIAGKAIAFISEPVPIRDRKAVVGTSIGIALFPRDSDDPDTLIKLADEAMYEVKRSGKNGYRFAAGKEDAGGGFKE